MNKKLWFLIGVTGIFITATLNVRLNMQKTTDVLLTGIEALSSELTPLEEEILLHGSFAVIPVKSYSATPLRAIKYSSHITVSYLVTLNNITVQIVKASGQTVYSNTVNPVAGGQLNISLASLPAGDYTIVFTAPNGSSMYGDFEI